MKERGIDFDGSRDNFNGNRRFNFGDDLLVVQ